MTALGSRIRQARHDAHLLQAGLAEAIGVCPDTIGHWENGYTEPTVTALEFIANATGKPLIYFVAPVYLVIGELVGWLADVYGSLDKEATKP